MPTNENSKPPVVTIDGPGGAGKGTAARRLAKALGWHLLDSGMIYRALGLASIQSGIATSDHSALAKLAVQMDIRFQATADDGLAVFLGAQEVSEAIRSEEAGMNASQVASVPEVREALLERQRAFAQLPGLVADGRDMGTVVFKNAPLKVFLTASVEARAKRRHAQLLTQGQNDSLARLSEAIEARDYADMNREVAPLRPAADAVQIDSTELSIADVGSHLLKLVEERGLLESFGQ